MAFFSAAEKNAIVKSSNIGSWRLIMENGSATGIIGDKTMEDLMGAPHGLTPKQLFVFYCRHIFSEDLNVVRKYIANLSFSHTEVEYRYNHPELGMRLVRCSGVKTSPDERVGMHQDITDSVHFRFQQSKTDRTLAQLTQRLYSYNMTVDIETGDYTLIIGTGMLRVIEILQRYTNLNNARRELDTIICPGYKSLFYNLVDLQKLKVSKVNGFIGNIEYPVLYTGEYRYEWHEVNVFVEIDENGKRVVNILTRDITAIHEQQEKIVREVNASAAKDQMLSDITKILYGFNIVVNLDTGKYSIIEGSGMTDFVRTLKSMDDYQTAFEYCLGEVNPEYEESLTMLIGLGSLRARKKRRGYISSIEVSTQTPHGLKWIEINVFISSDETGSSVANILGRDVSEAHEKADTKAQLEIATKASAAKTSFLFNMSHDIRTPMNAIMGFTDLLDKNQTNEAKRTDYIRKIRESSTVLLSIINNVLEMARIENGSVSLNEEAWDVRDFNNSLSTVFNDMMDSKHIEFNNEMHVKTDYVFCDAIKLREIYINILSNAYKYTMEGGKVTMVTDELPSKREGYVVFRTVVTDTGIGMSEDFLPHIFEEFSREHTSTENKIEGTGLGMPIVKKLLDIMGGTIEVTSQLGKGSQFTISIPHRVATKSDVKKQEGGTIRTEMLKGRRVLLAEDNDLNAEIAESILSEVGLIVDRAEDGNICIEKLMQNAPDYYDLILMDIQMPNLNGYEATKKIRSIDDEIRATIPIIAMTANAFEEDKREALNVGMNGHVAKPISVDKLMKVMVDML